MNVLNRAFPSRAMSYFVAFYRIFLRNISSGAVYAGTNAAYRYTMDYFALSSRHRYIGIFDSGAGGLNILNECRKQMPNENFLYFADIRNAPYGGKKESEIAELTLAAAEKMKGYGIKALLLACNTATSAAAEVLRKTYDFPVIGMEPAIKPAHIAASGKNTLLLCTPATARQEKLLSLAAKLNAKEKLIIAAMTDWAAEIENTIGDLGYITEKIERDLKTLINEETGAIVIGCTHYIFIEKLIKETAAYITGRDIPIFNGCEGTVKNLKKILGENSMLNVNKQQGQLLIASTANPKFSYWRIIEQIQ